MSEYINDFDEVCQSGSNSTTDRRPASDLELEQQSRIAELEAERDRLTNELDAAKKRRQEIDDEAFEYAEQVAQLEAERDEARKQTLELVEASKKMRRLARHYRLAVDADAPGKHEMGKALDAARQDLNAALAAQLKEHDDE
ncbi:MAG: hypothetical protein EBY40_01085 [Marivivens sp.]|nr:hypothetical protein [Marivivens sp.]NBT49989.1 hypothetical protein [Marivivens sp.]NCW67372.1 hypothetical protein [Marivivens sp.]NDH01702.1 hypothetical protein [Marivivens sp.]